MGEGIPLGGKYWREKEGDGFCFGPMGFEESVRSVIGQVS